MTQIEQVEIHCPRCQSSRCYWRQIKKEYICQGCGHKGERELFEHAVENKATTPKAG